MTLYHEKNSSSLGYFWVKLYTNICTLYFNIAAFSVHYQTQYLAKNSRFLGRKFLQVAVWSIYTAYICPSIVYNYTIWSHTGTVYYTVHYRQADGVYVYDAMEKQRILSGYHKAIMVLLLTPIILY